MNKQTLITAIILLSVSLLFGFFTGMGCGKQSMERLYLPEIESYQCQIDSIKLRLDSALAHIDLQYVPKDRIIVRTKYEYIIQNQENEKHEYFALDTSGRVAYFRQRVRERTGNRD